MKTKLTKDNLRALNVVNSHNALGRGEPCFYYRGQVSGRAGIGIPSGWLCFVKGFDLKAHWTHSGGDRLFDGMDGWRLTAKDSEVAMRRACERFGITEWERLPFDRFSWVPKAACDRLRARVAAALDTPNRNL